MGCIKCFWTVMGFVLASGVVDGRKQCGENEVYKHCKATCPSANCFSVTTRVTTCDEEDQPLACEAGCDCIPGFVRYQTSKCINSTLCPKFFTPKDACTGENEVFTNCKYPCPAQECASRHNMDAPNCPTDQLCTPGCVCKKGHLRDKNGICWPAHDCPPGPSECGVNEHYRSCENVTSEPGTFVSGDKCKNRSCRHIGHKGFCYAKCFESCICNDGYFRDEDGICILAENCPLQDPPNACNDPNKEYLTCASSCPATCDNYQQKNRTCGDKFCYKGCFCKPNYVLDDDDNCVSLDQCRQSEATSGTVIMHNEKNISLLISLFILSISSLSSLFLLY